MAKIITYLFFILNIAIIIAFWWTGSGYLITQSTADSYTSLGKLSGLLLVYFVLLQFLMRGRIGFLEKAIGYEELNTIHKKNGYIVLFFLLAHPILLTLGYSAFAKTSLVTQFINFLTDYDDVLNATIGASLFLTVVISSIYIVRKKLQYELWYFVHLATYIAVIFAWGHQLSIGSDFAINSALVYYWYGLYAATFGLILYFRLVRLMLLYFKHRFYVKNIRSETNDTISLEIAGKNLESFTFQPGQFLMIRFLNKNFWWESHPFSFSALKNGSSFRITVKKLGDFTERLPQIQKGTAVLIDGPHGAFTLESTQKEKILCIAGGIGITPIRALIEDALSHKKDVVLLYGNKTTGDIVFDDELKALAKKHAFPIHYVISQEPSYKGLQGRIDAALAAKLVPDIKERAVFICGPSGMPLILRNDLVKAGLQSNQIHFEKFSF